LDNTYSCSENKRKTQHEREKQDKEMSTQQVNKTRREERKMTKENKKTMTDYDCKMSARKEN